MTAERVRSPAHHRVIPIDAPATAGVQESGLHVLLLFHPCLSPLHLPFLARRLRRVAERNELAHLDTDVFLPCGDLETMYVLGWRHSVGLRDSRLRLQSSRQGACLPLRLCVACHDQCLATCPCDNRELNDNKLKQLTPNIFKGAHKLQTL